MIWHCQFFTIDIIETVRIKYKIFLFAFLVSKIGWHFLQIQFRQISDRKILIRTAHQFLHSFHGDYVFGIKTTFSLIIIVMFLCLVAATNKDGLTLANRICLLHTAWICWMKTKHAAWGVIKWFLISIWIWSIWPVFNLGPFVFCLILSCLAAILGQ